MDKQEQIAEIKRIIKEWGTTTSFELELESSPCINAIGSGKRAVFQLAEYFNSDGVTAISYQDQDELDEEDIAYEDLSEEVINEIYEIIEQYDLAQIKLYDSCKDENF